MFYPMYKLKQKKKLKNEDYTTCSSNEGMKEE